MNLSAKLPRAQCALFATIVGGALLVLSGCGIPPLRSGDPGPPLPTTFNGNTSADNSAYIMPSEFFEDPNLRGLINQALVSNQELKILAQDIAIANNEVMKRRGAWLPFISFGADASLDKYSEFTPYGEELNELTTPNGQKFPNPLPNFLVAANVTWQVDIWRQLHRARDAARLRYFGTVDGWNYVVTRLVAEIAENYYTLMALDKQIETLDSTIALQEQSLKVAIAQKKAARGTELAVQRFEAELAKNKSEKLIIYQRMIETENRINFLVGRYPQAVPRASGNFLDLNLRTLSLGVPAALLQNRPDIRQAERNLAAAGLDIQVARADFYPKLNITSGVGYEAFNTRFLFFTPESLIYGAAAGLVTPLVNKTAIRAAYLNANAQQLQALYEYQRTTLNAFTEVINRVSKVQNYGKSIEIKRQQLASLEQAVSAADKLFQNARVEYMDVLFAQRDRNDARFALIDTKREQLSAIVYAYQALGGGWRFYRGNRLPPVDVPRGGVEGPPVQMPYDQPPAGTRPEELPAPPSIKRDPSLPKPISAR
jgi:multidrug efflux system outer membrane protein